jgi:Tfp pilus assembly protein PilF
VKDAQSYYEYAVFLDRLHDGNRAEFMYRQALVHNPHHVDTLKSYGDFLAGQFILLFGQLAFLVSLSQATLQEQKRDVEAEAMYLAAREHSRKLTEGDGTRH